MNQVDITQSNCRDVYLHLLEEAEDTILLILQLEFTHSHPHAKIDVFSTILCIIIAGQWSGPYIMNKVIL